MFRGRKGTNVIVGITAETVEQLRDGHALGFPLAELGFESQLTLRLVFSPGAGPVSVRENDFVTLGLNTADVRRLMTGATAEIDEPLARHLTNDAVTRIVILYEPDKEKLLAFLRVTGIIRE